jgi:hypothetical protein
MSLISTPLFKTNGKEELATADVYKLTNSEPVNKLFEAAKNVGKNILSATGGRDALISSVSSLIQLKRSGATGKELFERGLNAFGTNTQALLTQGGGFIADKAGQYAGIDPAVMDKIKIASDGVVKTYSGNQANNLQQLLRLAGDVSGNSEYTKFINIGMEASLWGATISQAVEYNYPDMIKMVSANVDPDVMKQSMIYASGTVMQSGNLEGLLSMMDVLTVDEILGNNPDFIKTFLSGFTITDTWKPEEYPAKAVLLRDTLNKINPTWATFKRPVDPAPIYDLTALSIMSADGRKILTLITEMRDAIQIAPNFPVTTTYDLCRNQYPLSVAALK